MDDRNRCGERELGTQCDLKFRFENNAQGAGILTALSTGVVEHTNCISAERRDPTNECSGYDTKSDGGFSNAGVLGNVEYPFIAIDPRDTLVQSSSTWQSYLWLK